MYLDANELSQFLHIKRSTLYAWAARGKIPCVKIHGLVRFPREEIERWLASFQRADSKRLSKKSKHRESTDVDRLIASAKRNVYTARCGETRLKSSPIRKEGTDGAV